jgi:dimethylaniline monooxygenase (N-oxide forming)
MSMGIDGEKICIIGAGVGGIAVAYALRKAGVAFDWFEGGSQAGGLWRYNNDSGLSAMYSSLITNTSAPQMTLFGYPMPAEKTGYLTHLEVIQYLEAFLDQTGLRRNLTPSTWVNRVVPQAGSFQVNIRNRSGETSTGSYRAVVVANGRSWAPGSPVLRGFTGCTLHSFNYRTPDIFQDQRVVVAGFGNSGADIACDAALTARRVVLSTRCGGQLLSRYIDGKPRDQHKDRAWFYRLPVPLRRLLGRVLLLRRGLSDKARAALEGRSRFRSKPPVVNDNIAALIDADRITVRSAIAEANGKAIRFADGSQEDFDVLVWATGYSTMFPFFDREVLERNLNFTHRFLRVVAPDEPGLFFVGHAAVVGPVFPVIEQQALWVADLLTGRCTLPTGKLSAVARQESRSAVRLFPEVGRGEDSVEAYPYIYAVKRQRARKKARLT